MKNLKIGNIIIYIIYFINVSNLNQKDIQKMAEFLELKFSFSQTSYLASKNFKNKIQKNVN